MKSRKLFRSVIDKKRLKRMPVKKTKSIARAIEKVSTSQSYLIVLNEKPEGERNYTINKKLNILFDNRKKHNLRDFSCLLVSLLPLGLLSCFENNA
jgi:hypothetical protein